ncbi:hypothetical protein MFIFM68171_02779 [Madurella fahalii]|uniref:Clr5 domain-containing protein n=1 Tax=Madurella fahalii TaxID=1157608 RepID=A0ABQ0G4I1_9PEZI
MTHQTPPQPSLWQQHLELFSRLYLTENNSLERVKEIVERDHGFPETPLSTYEIKLRDELKLRKNMKAEHWTVIGQHLESRPCGSRAFFHGALVDHDKVKRYTRRYSKLRTDIEETFDASGIILLRENVLLAHGLRYRPQNLDNRGQDVQYSDYHQILSRSPPDPASLNRSLDSSLVPISQRSVVLHRTAEMLTSDPNSTPFVRFSAPILDDRFAMLWAPHLDKLPIIHFQRIARRYSDNNLLDLIPPFAYGSNWDSGSLITQEQIELDDAQVLGLSSSLSAVSHSTPNFDFVSPTPFDSQLPTFKNPFHAFTIIMHRLSNNASTDDISKLMNHFVQWIPDSLLKALLGLDCPTIRGALPELLR